MSDELVLGVPATVLHEAGLFQGFCADIDHYLPRLLDPRHLAFRPRSEAEQDPTFKQLIPYLVLQCGELVFHYQRGQKTTEKRLQALWSIGVGGHINPADHHLFDSLYHQGMLRELAEEVVLDTTYSERCLGLINDDAMPVGQVHLGIVHVLELAEPRVQRREQGLTRAGFAPLADLVQRRQDFETWSQFVLEILVDCLQRGQGP